MYKYESVDIKHGYPIDIETKTLEGQPMITIIRFGDLAVKEAAKRIQPSIDESGYVFQKKPGITKGQHWHNSKWEQFIVVHGHGLIQERNINTGEMVEFEVSGDKIEAIYMVPGWTHNIINLSDTEDLVTVMTCNEIFNPKKPDTFFEKV